MGCLEDYILRGPCSIPDGNPGMTEPLTVPLENISRSPSRNRATCPLDYVLSQKAKDAGFDITTVISNPDTNRIEHHLCSI